jgi:phage anti-repressor protein
MNELINITLNENHEPVVSARDLHKSLQVKTRFSQWVEQNFKILEEGYDFSPVVTTTQLNQYGGTKEIQGYGTRIERSNMNEIALSDNLQQIELEINWHKENAGKSIWEIGRRLNHVKENDLAHGEFGQWLEKIEINQRVANQFMKVASEIPNSSTYSNLGYNALYLIATLPEEEKQAQLERVEQGDNPTVRELQEVRRKLKESEERNKRLEERALQKEVVEKEVVVEKVPED